MLTKTLNDLFIVIRYGVWGLGVLGIVLSFILAFGNVPYSISTICICIGALCISITVAGVLLPSQFVKGKLLEKRYIISAITCVAAIVIVGIVYYTNGGFPNLNLLFM